MLFLFPAFLIYCEIILHVSTTGAFALPSVLPMLLFSFGYGAVAELICSFFTKEKTRRRVTTLLMLLIALLYLVAYFIHLEFKIFYDLNTVFFGAAGAVADFGSEIIRMVTSPEGILRIVLYLAPVLLYYILDRKYSLSLRADARMREAGGRAVYVACAVFPVLIGIFMIHSLPVLRMTYADAYNYTDVVREFGLLTGLRRDAVVLLTGSHKESGFVLDDAAAWNNTEVLVQRSVLQNRPEETVPEEETEPEEIVYEPNALDIDFEALAASSSGTLAQIDAYVATLEPSLKNEYTGMFKGKNLIIVAAEAFSGFIIDEELTPTLYRMHTKGIRFNNFYQPSGAGTTGGEYNILHGLLPMAGGSSMLQKEDDHNYFTMGSVLDREGYYGKMYHNGTHTFYERHRTHVKLGYSDGYLAVGNGLEKVITEGSVYSDYGMVRDTFAQYADQQPFNIYYMTISGHAPYSWGSNYFSALHRERVQDLPYSEGVQAYIASNLDLEDAMTFLIDALEEKGIADDTVIVLCADHFPYGLYDRQISELYGEPVGDSFFRDKNTLLIWSGALEEAEPVVVDAPVVSLDILPTLLNLFGATWDSRLLPGRDVLSDAMPLAFDMGYNWATDLGTYISARGQFTPADGVSEEDIPEGYVETIRQIVANKISFCRNLTYHDYYYHVFGDTPPGAVSAREDDAPEDAPEDF